MHFRMAPIAVFGAVVCWAAQGLDAQELRTTLPGLYVGGHFGMGVGRSSWSEDSGSSGRVSLATPFDIFKGTGSYFEGLQAGRNWVSSSGMLVGVEGDVAFASQIRGTTALNQAGARFQQDVSPFGSLRARLGYIWHDWLLYGIGGIGWTTTRVSREQIVGNVGAAGPGTSEETSPRLRVGLVTGAGVEVPLDQRWSASAEYSIANFGQQTLRFPESGDRFRSDLALQSVRIGLNYHVDAPVQGTVSAAEKKNPFEDWAVHGQTTFTYQYVAPFRVPYQGANSLQSNQARETWDATFYVGRKLWSGAELWINPEIDQGFGLSGTLGVAAFPSAEAYKVGAVEPYARLPRLFVRQTIGLGGETEEVVSGPNQLGGRQSKDRLVITMGKFSAPDVFDTNKYAHDPRTDFLNWGIVDTTAFDYAADAWAFTYGAAVEWYQGQWTVRAGVFDLPIIPNSTDLDPSFKQHQWIAEFERRYTLGGQPGKVAVTGFLSQGRMARFQDAINIAAQSSSLPDLSAARHFQNRTGASFNLEQQVVDGVGLFARAGIADGRTEPFAFTDADQTVAAGIVLSGKRWGRQEDTWGVAGLVNSISSVHQAYLNAGGLTALLGDGKLPHAGPEKVFETYYSVPFFKARLTGDYQFIENPGFNQDRGPISIFALRVRSSF